MRRTFSTLMLIFFAVLAVLPVLPTTAAAASGNVYVVHIDKNQVIDQGLAVVLQKAYDRASKDSAARGVALVVDTPGGYTSAALTMKETILTSKLPSVAYVSGDAFSSGALVATAAEKLYMNKGSSIGAAEVRVAGSDQPADYKTMSAWIAAFRSTAEARGRDPNLAQAMVDRNAKVPDQKGELLVLTANEAVGKHYANAIAADLNDALQQAGIKDYQLIDVMPTTSDYFGRFLTQPWVAILLLVVGVIAIGIEFMKPGVTLPGLVGVTCLTLFFLGNVLMGTAGWLELGLAFLGIVLLLVEAFIPGFGVFGFGGVGCMVASIFLAVPTPELATRYLMWTAVAFTFTLFAILRALSRRGLGKALTLKQHHAPTYVPARADLSTMVGREGVALTTLRPAGTAQFGNDKIDVVTEGEFLKAGTPIKVMRVDGARVLVRSLAEK